MLQKEKVPLLRSDAGKSAWGTVCVCVGGRSEGAKGETDSQEGCLGITVEWSARGHTRTGSSQRRRPQGFSLPPRGPFSGYKSEVLSVLSIRIS